MKTLLKIFAMAAAFGLIPAAAGAQQAAPAQPAQAAAVALPPGGAQPEAVSPASPLSATAAPAAAPVAADLPRAAPTPGVGQPDGRLGVQDQFTPIGEEAAWFHNVILLPVTAVISIFVLFLLLYVVVRYRRAAHPVPSRTTHNTLLEVAWTLVPVLILVVIAVPSIKLLANQYSPPKADLTVKVIGNQWYWTYQYPDNGDFEVVSNILSDADAKKRGEPRLLGVDERMVVPAGATVKLIVTSNDVIHAFALPAFWNKIDAVPGRLNETWFKVDRPGVYYGQCSELCGARHAYMPIAVEVVPPAQYAAWVASKGGTMPGTARPTSSDATANSPISNPAIAADKTAPAQSNLVDATANPPVSAQGATAN
jgi:cytochrome c oxidase subunit 2